MRSTMKLSKDTLEILKNFASINSNFYANGSKTISTRTISKFVYAEAQIDEDLPQAFGLYNLNEFLGVVSMFSDPEIEFCDTHAVIRQDKNSVKYVFSDKDHLDVPDKQIKMPAASIEFTLTEENMKALIKAASVLSLTDIMIQGNGSVISAATVNVQNPSSNTFSIDVGDTDQNFTAYMKVENLKLIATGIYEVRISDKKISQFKRHDGKCTFYVALEKNSQFD